PYIVDDGRPPLPADAAAHIAALVAANRRSEALDFWYVDVLRVPAPFVEPMRQQPAWAEWERMAHTLAYDLAIVEDRSSGKALDPAPLATVTAPTLVLGGGDSPAWMQTTVKAVAAALPDASDRLLAGQTHGAAPEVLAPVLVEFFAA